MDPPSTPQQNRILPIVPPPPPRLRVRPRQQLAVPIRLFEPDTESDNDVPSPPRIRRRLF